MTFPGFRKIFANVANVVSRPINALSTAFNLVKIDVNFNIGNRQNADYQAPDLGKVAKDIEALKARNLNPSMANFKGKHTDTKRHQYIQETVSGVKRALDALDAIDVDNLPEDQKATYVDAVIDVNNLALKLPIRGTSTFVETLMKANAVEQSIEASTSAHHNNDRKQRRENLAKTLDQVLTKNPSFMGQFLNGTFRNTMEKNPGILAQENPVMPVILDQISSRMDQADAELAEISLLDRDAAARLSDLQSMQKELTGNVGSTSRDLPINSPYKESAKQIHEKGLALVAKIKAAELQIHKNSFSADTAAVPTSEVA